MGNHRQPVGQVLVVSQVALSLVLLVGAGVFVRSLRNLNNQDAGFNRQSVLVVRVEPKGSDQKRGPTATRLNRIYQDLQERVEAIPGVLSASLAGVSPTTGINASGTIRTPSGQETPFGKVQAYPRFFKTLGMEVLTCMSIVSALGKRRTNARCPRLKACLCLLLPCCIQMASAPVVKSDI